MIKRKYMSAAFAALIFASVTTGCDDKDEYVSYPPTWKGFKVERGGVELTTSQLNTLRAGDKITVTAVQATKGHLINATNYIWTLTLPVYDHTSETLAQTDSVIEYKTHTNYDGLDNGDPCWELVIPAEVYCGREALPDRRPATITFEASYNYSANGVQAENGAYDTGLSGSITPYSGNLDGGARGTLRGFYIHSKECTDAE